MSTNTKPKLGRPEKPLVLPNTSTFTFTDVKNVNPQIKCKLTVYTRVNKLIKSRVLRRTGKTVPSGGENNVGTPLDVLQTVASYRRSKAAKQAARTRRNSVPVTLTA